MNIVVSTTVIAQEDIENTVTYQGNGYTVYYTINNSWTGNQNIEIKIENTGVEKISNWALKYDAQGEINGLWNGKIAKNEDTQYIIKNAGYNYEILPNQSVSFGYTVSGDELEKPYSFEMCNQKVQRAEESYKVSLNVQGDWGAGFIGEISVQNLSDAPIEAWKLDFDSNFVIDDIWNAVKISGDEFNHYQIENNICTTPIAANETKSFGFRATKESDVVPEITNCVLTEIVVNDDFSTLPDEPDEPIDPDDVELAISGYANYSVEDNALNIFWMTTVENGTFLIQESADNIDFINTTAVQNVSSYAYNISWCLC